MTTKGTKMTDQSEAQPEQPPQQEPTDYQKRLREEAEEGKQK